MPILNKPRHGDPIADIKKGNLPGAEGSAFATRQFQNFLDEIELLIDSLETSDKNDTNLTGDSTISGLNSIVLKLDKKNRQRILSLETQLSSYAAGLRQAVSRSDDALSSAKSDSDTKISSIGSGLNSKVERVSERLLEITANYTTNGNQVLLLSPSSAITITLNATPRNGERVSLVKKTDPIVSIVGSINGTSPTDFLFAGDTVEVQFSSGLGEWHFR